MFGDFDNLGDPGGGSSDGGAGCVWNLVGFCLFVAVVILLSNWLR